MQKNKRFLPLYIVLTSVAYLGAFFLTYEAEFLGAPLLLQYASDFIARFVDLLAPLCAAALLLPQLTARPFGALAWRTALIAVPILPRRFPEQYLKLLDGGLDSIEAVLIGLVFALGYAVLYFLIYLALLSVMRVLLRSAEKRRRCPVPDMRPERPFDGHHPWLIALAVFALPQAGMELISEILRIISFFSAYFHSFTAGEIVYMMSRLIFIPLSFVLSLYIAMRISMRITAAQTTPQLPRA